MHFLITAGGTREYIDPVRFISNASSGKMGCALAWAALKAAHKVTLISVSDLQPAVGVEFVGVDSAAEMFAAVKRHFYKCDCLIMAAAVADYTPARPVKAKIKKTNRLMTLKLKPTADILEWAGEHKKVKSKKVKSKKAKDKVVVGFALEDKQLRERAEKKLKEKKLDMIIANSPAAIAAEKSTVQIKTPQASWCRIENATKAAIAKRIIRLIEGLIC